VKVVILYDAAIQLFTGIASPAGTDINFIECVLLYRDIAFRCHCIEKGVKECFRVAVSPWTCRKGEDMYTHYAIVRRSLTLGFATEGSISFSFVMQQRDPISVGKLYGILWFGG
jgi:hypothetical protein